MQLKKILFYTFFIITSSSLSTLATTDSMQNPLTQGISFELKNKKDSFYEYDLVDYLCAYKLTITIMNVRYYFICFVYLYWSCIIPNRYDILKYFGINKFWGSVIYYIIIFIVIHFIISLLKAACYRDGVNSFKKRFIFWLKTMLIYNAIPVITYLLAFLLTHYNWLNFPKSFSSIISVGVIHLLLYISAWIYPEKVKSILYRFSNKFKKAKSASK